MVYPIEVYGSPILRKVSVDIPINHPDLKQLIADMFETMYGAEGMGLAAPQIGLNFRLIVIDTTQLSKEEPAEDGFKMILVNPKIIEYSGPEILYNEGCLSLPGIREEVSRPDEVLLEYYDEHCIFHTETFTGLRARVIQHEIDHIEGKLFIDRIAPIRKKLLKGRLSDISKGLIETRYRIRIPGKPNR